MKSFKFFQKTDKLFPEWMDRMDDHLLGIEEPREYREVLVISASWMDFVEWRSIYHPDSNVDDSLDFFQRGNVRYHSATSIDDILGRVFDDVQVANQAYQDAQRVHRIREMIEYARPLFRR